MAMTITDFFKSLGLPLYNPRWSWGAVVGETMLLRTWADEFLAKPRRVGVLRYLTDMNLESVGLDERIAHLEKLWSGSVAGYVVVATARDPKASPREIKEFREDVVFPVTHLELDSDGSIHAALDAPVRVSELRHHAITYRTQAAEGQFPIPTQWRSNTSTASLAEKVPLVRAWLVEVARAGSTVTYGEVMDRYGLAYYQLLNVLGQLGRNCLASGEPVITALVVNKDGHCSEGILKSLGVQDDEAERQRCYKQWSAVQAGSAGQTASRTPPAPEPQSEPSETDLDRREARFVEVQVRTEQAEFRRAVFRRFNGRCVVTGCCVPEALEAAHIKGRIWREGHNRVEDGLLLRRDVHALYDRGLLDVSSEFDVRVDESIAPEYGRFASPATPD